MSSTKIFHDAIKNALTKNGWTLENPSFELKLLDDDCKNGSEFVQIFEKEGKKIAVLVEHFLSSSPMQDYYFAFGRYLNCRLFLSKVNSELTLYSAVSVEDNENIFKLRFISKMIADNKIRQIIYDLEKQEIKYWNKNLRIMSPRLANQANAKLFEKRIEIDL